jgi:chemosensory pili system protein ChpB (putative protein-glutamate methylesterase)
MPQPPLRVALVTKSGEGPEFRALLESRGMEVVLDEALGSTMPQSWNGAEVVLVDLNDQVPRAQLHRLIEASPAPVLLNHGGLGNTERWSRGLLAKLQGLTGRRAPGGRQGPGLHVVEGHGPVRGARPYLVVLCGSMGGPVAVAQFLRELPGGLPIGFLLAQHISEPAQKLLAQQLDRCGACSVAVLGEQQELEPGKLWVVPAENKVVVETSGLIQRRDEAWSSAQKPDINALLSNAAEVFGDGCGAIMFSGLGGDGAQGCERIIERGGFVWTQSSESCAISNLPAAAMRAGKVEFTGTPEQLARELTSRCQAQFASLN